MCFLHLQERRGFQPFFFPPERSGNFFHTSWCHMPEEYILHSLCHVNLRSRLMKSHVLISLRWCYQIKVFSLLHPSVCWSFHCTVLLTWPTHYILCRFSCLNFATRIIFSFAVACWPAWSQWIYIYNFFMWRCGPKRATVSFLRFLDHTHTHTVGALWTRDQLVAETSAWQHTTRTINIDATGDIRTHSLSRRAATDLRLRPRGHWDRRGFIYYLYVVFGVVIPYEPYIGTREWKLRLNWTEHQHGYISATPLGLLLI